MSFGSGQSYTDFGRPTNGTPAGLEPFIEVMLRGIVGFRFAITRLEGKWKMSQNRDKKDRDGVVQGLGKRRRSDDLEIAEIVSGLVTSSN
jgi:predicted FMN-binding regulatory protein PaiB